MATHRQPPKLLVIVGPTASGKSDLALRIARKHRGEIIAADSRTIYKSMDIGTAKPSANERNEVRHWGLDLVEPGQRFTTYDFQKYAEAAIADIQGRGRLPILVGGTGLYINAVLFQFKIPADRRVIRRKLLELRSVASLQKTVRRKGYPMPANRLNKRHLIRALERGARTGSSSSKPLPGSFIVGLQPDDIVLKERINRRAEAIFDQGVVAETTELIRSYGRRSAMRTSGIVYRICLRVIDGKIDEAQALSLFKTADWQYARRQRTWFKRNKYIQWYDSPDKGLTAVEKWLNNKL